MTDLELGGIVVGAYLSLMAVAWIFRLRDLVRRMRRAARPPRP